MGGGACTLSRNLVLGVGVGALEVDRRCAGEHTQIPKEIPQIPKETYSHLGCKSLYLVWVQGREFGDLNSAKNVCYYNNALFNCVLNLSLLTRYSLCWSLSLLHV